MCIRQEIAARPTRTLQILAPIALESFNSSRICAGR